MNLANGLTLARILTAPVVLILLLKEMVVPAFWAYALAALTDTVDGLVARRFAQETRLGALLDPAADKLMMVCVFPGLVVLGLIESWVFAAFITRDVIVALGWLLIYILLGDADPHTRLLGKAATLAQMTLGAAVLFAAAYRPAASRSLAESWTQAGPIVDLLSLTAVALSAVSMLNYLLVGSRRIK